MIQERFEHRGSTSALTGISVGGTRPLAVVAVPQLLQFVMAPLHVVLHQTLQSFLLSLHHLTDINSEKTRHKTRIRFLTSSYR